MKWFQQNRALGTLLLVSGICILLAAAHANLGWALLGSGKARESIPEFEAALHFNPEFKAAAEGLRQAQAQLSSQR